MIELAEGARRIDDFLDDDIGDVFEDFPSGQRGAIFETDPADDTSVSMTLGGENAWDKGGRWWFSIIMLYYEPGYNYYYEIHSGVPTNNTAAAERAEEEMTILFNTIVKEIQAGKDPKKVAESHGLDLTEVQDW